MLVPGKRSLGPVLVWLVVGCAIVVVNPAPALADNESSTVRVATFNVKELGRAKLDVVDALGRGTHPQLIAAARIIQHVRPDVLVLNEIDYDAGTRRNAAMFVERYLAVSRSAVSRSADAGIDYPYILFLPTNTGVPSGFDFSGDGQTDGPEDAWGFGRYPGQYGMALLSRWPFERAAVRTFRRLPWQAMLGNLMPDGTDGKPAFYDAEVAAAMRLSSKSHWDVPVRVGDRTLHLLVSHPTPPVFDGDEDRNGRRNFDEVRLWADYVSGGALTGDGGAGYLVDDRGRRGGLAPDAAFVILGDLNADPVLGEPMKDDVNAIGQLLRHPRVQDPAPRSAGAAAFDRPYAGDPATRTAAFGRADYVLPSSDLTVSASGVVWPAPGEPLHEEAVAASDHRLVWVDLVWP